MVAIDLRRKPALFSKQWHPHIMGGLAVLAVIGALSPGKSDRLLSSRTSTRSTG